MPVQIEEQTTGGTMSLRLSGTLTKEDYAAFVPRIEELIAQHGEIRLLVEMRDFHGWEAGALWEDIKFDARHFADIERLALVGERKWHQDMAAFCRPFTKATVRYFDRSERDQAWRWLRKEQGVPTE